MHDCLEYIIHACIMCVYNYYKPELIHDDNLYDIYTVFATWLEFLPSL